MRRSVLLVLIAMLAVAVSAPAMATAGAAGTDAQASAKAKAKGKAKKKAAKCKTAKKKGKGKARKSLAADAAAKGKKKAKRKCAKAKKKATKKKTVAPRRYRSPHEKRLIERYKQRREEMERRRESRPKPPTLQEVAPADGTYGSPSAPSLTVTVSKNSTEVRVVYTLAKTAFQGATCQTQDVAIDVTGKLSLSQSTGKAYLTADWNAPNGDSKSVSGYLGKDSLQLGVSASYEQPPGAGSFCSGNVPLAGALVKQ